MEQKQQLRHYLQQFKLGGIGPALDTLIAEAEGGSLGYMEYTLKLLATEAAHRAQNDLNRRLKEARLPRSSDLESYDHSFGSGLSKTRMNQLRELHWLDQIFNVILLGPSGVGKTRVAAGLCSEALHKGYRAYFRTMEEIMSMLKMKEVTQAARSEYRRLLRAHLIVIDDIMLFPVEKTQAVSLFNFINQLYEKTSFIVTTNKKPAEWAAMLGDEVLATALLDRLLYQCEVINLSGKSYRLQNRKTIFEEPMS